MDISNNMCNNLAKILGGKGESTNGVCKVTIDRHDINATIGNKKFTALEHMFVFEAPDATGNSLITGEMVLLEKEVPGMVTSFSNSGIIVSAIHTHWLFDSPKLIYIHVEAVMAPESFATRVAQILKQRI